MLQDAGGIGGGSPREGPTLEGVDEGADCRLGREVGGYHSLKNFRERSKEDDNPKEEGEWYEGLPGLSRMIPSVFLREGG